jgi:hypothetical protein
LCTSQSSRSIGTCAATPATAWPVLTVVGEDGVDPVPQQRPQPHKVDLVPQHRAQLARLRRDDSRLRPHEPGPIGSGQKAIVLENPQP